MFVKILGAAAGGGLPQWNCGCKNCQDARLGVIPSLTQSSIAVSVNGQDWLLLNASPDIRDQFTRSGLHPATRRGSPVKAVVLTNGDVDHIAGLLTLRESTAFVIHATPATLDILTQPIFQVLNADLVLKSEIALEESFAPLPDLQVTAFAVPGKVALFLEQGEVKTDLMGEQTIGLELIAGGKRLVYIPGCAQIPDDLKARIEGADMLLFDGTVWQDDEMAKTGTGVKTGGRMGHLSMSGPAGTMALLSQVNISRKWFIHINNTNPALQPESPERRALMEQGWQVALDGMEFSL